MLKLRNTAGVHRRRASIFQIGERGTPSVSRDMQPTPRYPLPGGYGIVKWIPLVDEEPPAKTILRERLWMFDLTNLTCHPRRFKYCRDHFLDIDTTLFL